METHTFIGIEIGGTKLQIVSGYADGSVLKEHKFRVDREMGAQGIRDNIEKVLDEYRDENLAAIAVGFGGPVDRQRGRVETSFHIEGWSGFPIANWLIGISGAPVYVENDANVAALGEAVHGAGRDFSQVLYITMGSGVGGGLVNEGQIYHGASPGELEIGHLQMDRKGTTLQDLCSGWGVDEKIRKAIAVEQGTILAKLAGGRTGGGEAIFLKEAVEAGDETAIRIFEETTDDFAYALSHVVHVVHPEVVVLGGGLSMIGDLLKNSIERKLGGYLMKAFAPGPPIRLAELREKAVPVGCLALAAQKIKNV